jgi:hypothetical protein
MASKEDKMFMSYKVELEKAASYCKDMAELYLRAKAAGEEGGGFKLSDIFFGNKLFEVWLMPFLSTLFSFSCLLFDRLVRFAISSEIR